MHPKYSRDQRTQILRVNIIITTPSVQLYLYAIKKKKKLDIKINFNSKSYFE